MRIPRLMFACQGCYLRFTIYCNIFSSLSNIIFSTYPKLPLFFLSFSMVGKVSNLSCAGFVNRLNGSSSNPVQTPNSVLELEFLCAAPLSIMFDTAVAFASHLKLLRGNARIPKGSKFSFWLSPCAF